MAAEYVGVPAVAVGAPSFEAQIYSTAVNRGIPAPRAAIYPGAFSSHTEEELIKNTREVVYPQVIDALTRPITQEEIDLRTGSGENEMTQIIFTGTLAEVNEYFVSNQMSDGLPIVPPTPARVEEFLKYTDWSYDRLVGTIAPGYRDVLVYHVAVNGVMAGCKPEWMPLMIAYVRAMNDGNFRKPLLSTHGWNVYALVSGPVARQLGFDDGQGGISEEANRAFGRFINLAMMNIAGYYVKENRMGTFGYVMPWTFAEDEEACFEIGWDPYHVQQGYNINANAITAGSAMTWGSNFSPATSDPVRIKDLIAYDVVEKGQNAIGCGNATTERTIIMTAPVARALAERYSKDSLINALIETARKPAVLRAYARYWANPGSQQSNNYTFDQYVRNIISTEGATLTDPPPWYRGMFSDQMYTVPVLARGEAGIFVTGDSTQSKVQTMAGGGRATIQIELPREWDNLMAELGYEPLRSFYLG